MFILLRIVRVFLLLAGLAVLGFTIIAGGKSEDGGSQFVGEWRCETSTSEPGVSRCYIEDGHVNNQALLFSLVGLGLGLIGTAIALGQFDMRGAATDGHRGQPGYAGAPPQHVPAHAAGPYQPHSQQVPLQQ